MTYFLIFILIVFFCGYLLRRYWPYLLMWMLKRNLTRQADDMERRRQAYYQQQRQQRPRRGKTKIYSREEGEYVEFEDLPGAPEQTTTEVKYTAESQITDVEWEDL